jgi:hypothetical protein
VQEKKMNEVGELENLIVRTVKARSDYLSAGTCIAWLIYQDLYLALGRRAFNFRLGLICPQAMQAMNQLALDIN